MQGVFFRRGYFLLLFGKLSFLCLEDSGCGVESPFGFLVYFVCPVPCFSGCGFFFFQWGQYGFEVFIRVYVSDVLATQGAGVCLFGYEPFAQGNKVFLQTCPHGVKQVIRFFVFLFGGAESFFCFSGFFAQGGQVLFLFVDVFFQSGCFGCSGFDGLQGLLQLPYRYIGLVGLFQLLVDRGGIHGFTLLA